MSSEYDAEQEELQRLVNEYNNLVSRKNALVNEYNMLVAELQYSLEATITCINNAVNVHNYVVPKLAESTEYVSVVAEIVGSVQAAIEDLSNKYFTIKNISTASKKLTQLTNEYQKNFGLYNILRRVTLGYVVGVDSNIISNESLRTMVEKNYLQNFDYWISHCLMATMLWVSDEKEAAERAVEKAMSIDQHKSSLFFLLINLRFGRSDAAAKWFEYYIRDVNVNNIGDEIRILLQAYLYNVCGNDADFKSRMKKEFGELLASVKNNTPNYDNKIKERALDFINAYVYKTNSEYPELQGYCQDYKKMITALEDAEKNVEFAKYFTELLEADSSAPMNLLERIENVLYDLVNTYDEAELAIIKSMDHNDMILRARGDLAAAQKMYDIKYRPEKAQSLGDLMVKLALPASNEEVDIRVRKFAVTFLCQNIIAAFRDYRKHYQAMTSENHPVTIDSFTVTVNEKRPADAEAELRDCYKKNRSKFIRRDKKVKTLSIFTIIFWLSWVACTAICAATSWNVVAVIFFVLTFLASAGFTAWLIYQIKVAGAEVTRRMHRGLEKLVEIVRGIQDWRKKYNEADKNGEVIFEVLEKFMKNEEDGQ